VHRIAPIAATLACAPAGAPALVEWAEARRIAAAPVHEAATLRARCATLHGGARDLCVEGLARRGDAGVNMRDCRSVQDEGLHDSCVIWVANDKLSRLPSPARGLAACREAGVQTAHCAKHFGKARERWWRAEGLTRAADDLAVLAAAFPAESLNPDVARTVGEALRASVGVEPGVTLCNTLPGAGASACAQAVATGAPPGRVGSSPVRAAG
jgi:hypothetical protein